MAAITHRLRCEILEARLLTATDVVKTLDVAVQAGDLTGLRGAEIRLNYDTQSLDLRAEDIRPGAGWSGSASVISNVDEEQGTVNVFVFTVEPITAGGGPLLDLKFQVADDVVADVAMATLSQTVLNEGTMEGEADLTASHGVVHVDQPDETRLTPPVTGGLTGVALTVEEDGQMESVKACSPWALAPMLTMDQPSSSIESAQLVMPKPIQDSVVSDLVAPPVELKKIWSLDAQ